MQFSCCPVLASDPCVEDYTASARIFLSPIIFPSSRDRERIRAQQNNAQCTTTSNRCTKGSNVAVLRGMRLRSGSTRGKQGDVKGMLSAMDALFDVAIAVRPKPFGHCYWNTLTGRSVCFADGTYIRRALTKRNKYSLTKHGEPLAAFTTTPGRSEPFSVPPGNDRVVLADEMFHGVFPVPVRCPGE